jgi:16S rRNA (guanine527-N7)-methyltransferase
VNVQPWKATPAFLDAIAELGVEFEAGDLDRLGRYLATLEEANRQFNLTRIVDPDEAWMRHIYDSLTLLPIISGVEAGSVCDVGSGGGVPGIPLAICLPDVPFTLVESTGKKARFCASAAEICGCANVRVVNERAETVGQMREEHRESYDVVVARAVGAMAVVAELTVPLTAVGGLTLLIKGAKADEELKAAGGALRTLGAAYIDTLPTETGRIVVLEKQRTTPRIYPRRPGDPKREPLS